LAGDGDRTPRVLPRRSFYARGYHYVPPVRTQITELSSALRLVLNVRANYPRKRHEPGE
jgi:hypothetical protein